MPRDATGTRDTLLHHAQRLFATNGVYRVTVREITQSAGQRNVSALSYHFGSREGVLQEILSLHGSPLDEERGLYLASLDDDPSTRALVASLLVPLARRLATDDGRDYLRIVSQLTDRFPVWRVEGELTPPNLRRILGLLEDRAAATSASLRRERVVEVIMLLTAAMAERARRVENGSRLELGQDAFLANLADMVVAALEAPVGELLSEGF